MAAVVHCHLLEGAQRTFYHHEAGLGPSLKVERALHHKGTQSSTIEVVDEVVTVVVHSTDGHKHGVLLGGKTVSAVGDDTTNLVVGSHEPTTSYSGYFTQLIIHAFISSTISTLLYFRSLLFFFVVSRR